MSYRLDAVYPEQVRLAALIGLPHESEAESRARTEAPPDPERGAIHECGHALAGYLLPAVRFVGATLQEDGTGYLSGWCERFGLEPLPPAPLEARLAAWLGGAIAEVVEFGKLDPMGAWTDLRAAYAIVGAPELALVTPAQLDALRANVAAIRAAMSEHREALRELARHLRRSGRLTGEQCRELLAVAGRPMPTPRYDHRGPEDERARVRAAEEAVEGFKRANACYEEDGI